LLTGTKVQILTPEEHQDTFLLSFFAFQRAKEHWEEHDRQEASAAAAQPSSAPAVTDPLSNYYLLLIAQLVQQIVSDECGAIVREQLQREQDEATRLSSLMQQLRLWRCNWQLKRLLSGWLCSIQRSEVLSAVEHVLTAQPGPRVTAQHAGTAGS
jgi:hypothetical protein